MTLGIAIVKWDKLKGGKIVASYPDKSGKGEKPLLDDEIIKDIYGYHMVLDEPGIIPIVKGPYNLASFYTGSETLLFINLLLEVNEDFADYEDALSDIGHLILANLAKDAYKKILPSLFQRISEYPKFSEEQKIAVVINNDIKRALIQRLRKDAWITLAEMNVWLKDEFKETFSDIDSILLSLIKAGLVKRISFKGMNSEVIFLIRDIMVCRVPPTTLIYDIENRGLPVSLVQPYRNKVREFFLTLKPSEEEVATLFDEIMLDPQVYETLKLMREAAVTRDDLEKLSRHGVVDIDHVLDTLNEFNFITTLSDQKENEYYCLHCDLDVDLFFPDYLLDNLRDQLRDKSGPKKIIEEILEDLREEFMDLYNQRDEDLVIFDKKSVEGKRGEPIKIPKEFTTIDKPKIETLAMASAAEVHYFGRHPQYFRTKWDELKKTREKNGFPNWEDLLPLNRRGMEKLAQASGIPYHFIDKWQEMADFMRIRGITEEFAEILVLTNVFSVKVLSHRRPKHLLNNILLLNEEYPGEIDNIPDLVEIKDWVGQAKKLNPMIDNK